MIDTKKIIAAAERHLRDTDMFVVDCTCTAGNEVELLIDSDTSVSIDACAALSRAVEAEFDRDAEDFSLTVASAGIGSELRHPRQYAKLVGSSVEVLLLGGIKILARLDAADDEGTDALLRGEAGRGGSEAQTAGDRDANLSLRRDQIHEGVPRFQITPPRGRAADETAARARNHESR